MGIDGQVLKIHPATIAVVSAPEQAGQMLPIILRMLRGVHIMPCMAWAEMAFAEPANLIRFIPAEEEPAHFLPCGTAAIPMASALCRSRPLPLLLETVHERA